MKTPLWQGRNSQLVSLLPAKGTGRNDLLFEDSARELAGSDKSLFRPSMSDMRPLVLCCSPFYHCDKQWRSMCGRADQRECAG